MRIVALYPELVLCCRPMASQTHIGGEGPIFTIASARSAAVVLGRGRCATTEEVVRSARGPGVSGGLAPLTAAALGSVATQR